MAETVVYVRPSGPDEPGFAAAVDEQNRWHVRDLHELRETTDLPSDEVARLLAEIAEERQATLSDYVPGNPFAYAIVEARPGSRIVSQPPLEERADLVY